MQEKKINSKWAFIKHELIIKEVLILASRRAYLVTRSKVIQHNI